MKLACKLFTISGGVEHHMTDDTSVSYVLFVRPAQKSVGKKEVIVSILVPLNK